MKRLGLPFVTSVLFAGSYVAGKYTTADLGPLLTTLLRYAVALVFLLCLLPGQTRSDLRVSRADWMPVLLLGLFGIIGYHYFFFSSLRYTAVANTAIINALSPVLTAVGAAVVLSERLSRRNYLGIALTVVGVILLITEGDLNRLLRWELNRGDLMMLISVLCWMVYALLVRRLSERYGSYAITLYATLSGVAVLALAVPTHSSLAEFQDMSVSSAFSIVYMGIFASGLGYLLYNASVSRLGPTVTSGVVYGTVPVLVAILALIFFGQNITAPMLGSAGVVTLGLYFILSPTSPPTDAREQRPSD